MSKTKIFFESKNFVFKYVSEQVIHSFSDYIEGKSPKLNDIFEQIKEEAIAEEDEQIFNIINIIESCNK